MTRSRFKVLLVEDDPSVRKLLRLGLGVQGFDVTAVDCAEEALSRFDALQPEAVLTDIGLPGMDGAALTRRLKRETGIPIFMMSGMPEPAVHEADEFFSKPLDPERVGRSIQDACEHWQDRGQGDRPAVTPRLRRDPL